MWAQLTPQLYLVLQMQRLAYDGLPCKVAGLVPAEAYQAACEEHLKHAELLRNARFMNLALLAATQALQVRWYHMQQGW